MLYLCATPIGNLEDITLRALRILKEVDLIAAEDTRNTRKLLNYFEISTPMTSYHEHNKYEKAEELVRQMQEGKSVALVTDAGTPAISDPGEELVRQCVEANVPVTALPGATACITALILSGKPTGRFCFEAFLPTENKERQRILEGLKTEERTILLYEAPHRLLRTLQDLLQTLGDREITICRELTKKHEECIYTTIQGAVDHFTAEEPRGEFVLVIAGRSRDELEEEKVQKWEEISIAEHVNLYTEKGYGKKEAMRAVAQDRKISRHDVYQELLETEKKT